MTDTPPPTNADLNERERRLRADIQDARKALNLARDRFDQLCEELLDLRYERQQRAAARTTTS
ncbi:hypothetical protein KV557_10090 [Kitasatospora aureofaciens]|uniref:hypothetical protein n=1 Tax=Kitasatospora aureofaciens TaxID=1894 RepID=UPI001C476694|nr:hypothetical protein [Kitasatospora aureofaciens]MBV6697474.1 hypothetical protein [Kitasatospora aureofaciens]